MIDLFMDSGAFTFLSKNKNVDIEEYRAYIQKNSSLLDICSSMDVIGSWQKSVEYFEQLNNGDQKFMPCFHIGEPFHVLEKYMEQSDILSIGGMVPLSYKELRTYLDFLFPSYLCDKKGYPKVKVHGFGMTDQRLMFRYPWYSVDSSTWIRVSRMGIILLPKMKFGSIKWNSQPIRIQVSDKGPHESGADTHIDIMPKIQRRYVLDYIANKGFVLGKSLNMKDGTFKVVEKGLCNSYELRDLFNMKYIQDLESSFDPYPTKLSIKRNHLFT